jgi:glycerate 2-kinase
VFGGLGSCATPVYRYEAQRKGFSYWQVTPRGRNVAVMKIPELRDAAKQIWETSLDAACPDVCIPRSVELTRGGFRVGDKEYEVSGRLIVIGAGKAGAGMARVVEEIFGDRISAGLVITKYGHLLPTETIQVFEAGHPVPDQAGELAVHGMREILHDLSPEDLVLCLISGGGSALLPAPVPGITLEQKQDLTSNLLRAGATIRELNAVRKHLSAIKGGQLMEWTAPAQVVSLIMSDVIGDPLDFIASGPTAPDTTTFADALGIVQKYGLDAPGAVLERLDSGARGEIPETPKRGDPMFGRVNNHIVANNQLLVEAAASKARELGFNTLVLSSQIEGEARDVGRFFASIAREIGLTGNPVGAPACVLAAGETTVTVRGQGLGGRNQEMALAWAIKMQAWRHPTCFASVATDGTDGPTDAAGGLVDPFTCSRSVEMNYEPTKFLRSNDSYTFLKAVRDLIITGPTQTNLMDIQILLAG